MSENLSDQVFHHTIFTGGIVLCIFIFRTFLKLRINLFIPVIHEELFGMSTGSVTACHRIRIVVCRTDFEHWPRDFPAPIPPRSVSTATASLSAVRPSLSVIATCPSLACHHRNAFVNHSFY